MNAGIGQQHLPRAALRRQDQRSFAAPQRHSEIRCRCRSVNSFNDRSRRLFDRSPRHIELRPVEFGAQFPGEGDFVGDGLPIDIGVIVAVAHAQQPVLPDLNETLGRGVKTDHQRLLQRLQLMRNRNARHQRNVRGADAAVGKIDRGRRFRGARHADQNHLGLFQSFDMLAVIMHHRVIQRVDPLEIFRIQHVLRADAAAWWRRRDRPETTASPGR